MARPSYLILAVAAVLPSTLAHEDSCSGKYPIYVDIHNRTVSGGGREFQYGSFIGVGVPYQNQSMWPSLRRNETIFAGKDFCTNSNLTDCINNTGGTVDFNASTSWKEDASYQSKDSSSIANSSVYGTDDIHLYIHYFDPSPASAKNVTNTPVEYALGGDKSPGIVGLGSASTLMQSLVDQEMISAKVYSMFTGDGMIRAGPGLHTGGATYGGYDAARMTGKVHTYDMDLSQPDFLPVTITDIVVDDPNNSQVSNRSILDNGSAFEVRITTDQYPMRLPAKVTQNFAALLGANSSDSSDGSLQSSQPFRGAMKIRLDDGFEITLPKETVLPPNGLFPVQETDEDYDGPFYLSTAWLSQVYLTLDYDAKKFHLAQAILNTTYIIPRTLCPGDTPEPHNYNGKNSSFIKNGMIGVVLGGVIGGVFVTAAIIFVFVWWRRHQITKEQQQKNQAAAEAGKTRNSDDVEMESLSPDGQVPKFPWSKGKAPMGTAPDGDTAYQGRSFSDADIRS